MKTLEIIYFLLILFATSAFVNAQCVPVSTAAGAFDTCFDGDGKVTTDITAGFDFADAVVVQPDGKIVAAGTAGASSTSIAGDFAVVRYNTDGSLDTTFDGDGIAITDFGDGTNDGDRATGIALQADGKIVVVGRGYAPGGSSYAIGAVRYNANGSLDTSFDGDGKVYFTLSNVGMDANDVVIQPDGKIVVVGSFLAFDNAFSFVIRFNSDGSSDTSFDTDGWRLTDLQSARAVALQRDGKIVIAGGINAGEMGVVRLNPNGSGDLFFGNNGVAVYAANFADNAWTMAIRFDGSIFAGGTSSLSQGETYGGLVRFRTDGIVGASMMHTDDNVFWDLAFQSDGKTLTVGRSFTHPGSGFTIRRFIDAYILDTSFNGGVVRVKFLPATTPESVHVSGITTTRDNKIVAVGQTAEHTDPPSPGSFAVTRLFSGLLAPHAERFDFDGDGKADVSVYRPSEKRWYVFRSSDSGVTEVFYGSSGDVPVPADYDADGKTDFALFTNAGNWKYLSSASGAESVTHWGSGGDIPRVSDFNGDGRADFILYRPLQNFWYRLSQTGEFINENFGLSGDKPVAGDFDGDGKSDKAIYRPSTGDWWYQSSIDNAQLAVHWGISTDVPAAGDYDGDGKTDFAVYRPSTGVWYIVNSGDLSFTILNFGLAEDKPVPADYDGDGKVDIAVFRPSNGTWYLLRSTAGFAAAQFGVSTDVPLPSAYLP